MLLTPAQKKYLKAEAHNLSAVVQVGKSGLTRSLIKEVSNSMEAHELIKVKLMQEKEERKEIAAKLVEETSCSLVYVLGNMIILFKQKKDPAKRKFKLPRS